MRYLLSIFFCFVLALSVMPQSGELKLEVDGIKPLKGNLYVALYSKKSNFLTMDSAYKRVIVPVKKDTMIVVFNDVKPGHYALAVFHDKNMNGKLDKNNLGIPREGYGFSKNVNGVFGPPSFEDAAFDFKDSLSLKIKLIYNFFRNE